MRLQCSLKTSGSDVKEINLVSSPGFRVLDSGCGKTIVGSPALAEFEKLWRQRGRKSPDRFNKRTNSVLAMERLTSHIGVAMLVSLGPHCGVIRASIVQGSAPLLISRSAFKKLGKQLDFQKDTLSSLGSPPIQLRTNSAGQYIVDVMGSVLRAGDAVADEIMMASADVSPALDSCAQASNAAVGVDRPVESCALSAESGNSMRHPAQKHPMHPSACTPGSKRTASVSKHLGCRRMVPGGHR
jgi:hypothetical protein